MQGRVALRTILVRAAGCGMASALIALVLSVFTIDGALDRTETRAPAGAGNAESGQAAPGPGGIPRFQPEAGTRYVYVFERKIDFSGFGKASPSIDFKGMFIVDALWSGRSGFDAVIDHTVNGAAGGPTSKLLIRVREPGTTLKLTRAQDSSNDAPDRVAILKDLAANWLFMLSEDTTGKFKARLEITSSAAGGLVARKSKRAYEGLSVRPEIVHSEHWMNWDSSRKVPLEIRGIELTKMPSFEGLSADSRYLLRLVRVEKSPIEATKLVSTLVQSDSLGVTAAGALSALHAEVGWADLEESLKALRTLPPSEQLRVFGELTRLLRKDSALARALYGWLRDQNAFQDHEKSTLFRAVVGALATAGTPETQAEVLRIYSDRNCSTADRGTILAALTTTQAPLTAETREFLAGLMRDGTNADLALGAGFALGASLQNAPDDSIARKSIEAIREAWSGRNSDAMEQLSLLDVMGNSGRSEYLGEIRTVIESSSDATMRAKAVFALRFMQDAASVELLARTFDDPEPRVRDAAVRAVMAATWNSAFLAPVEKCAKSEVVAGIQENCKALLSPP